MKQIKMPIRKTPKGWTFSVPSSISPTGNRYRPFFETKRRAEAERQVFLNNKKRYGSVGNVLTASETEDARAALDLIKGQGTTLQAVVRNWLNQNEIRTRTLSIGEILERVYRIKAGIEPSPLPGASRNPRALRDSTLDGMRKVFDKVIEKIGKLNATELNTIRAKAECAKLFRSDSRFDMAIRYLKAAFNFAMKAEWTPHNPFQGIEKEHRPSGEIDILETADKARAVLKACKDYRGKESLPEYCRVDCRGALAGFALAIFAGIRPSGELRRLTWNDISFEHGIIRIPGEASKTHTLRHVEMDSNLIAWLKPLKGETTDPVCGLNWAKRYKAVRRVTGLNKRAADILRHTYASAFLSAGRSMDELLQNMGHTTQKTTLKHYVAAMTPHEARAFWMVGPKGWTPLESVETPSNKKTKARAQ